MEGKESRRTWTSDAGDDDDVKADADADADTAASAFDTSPNDDDDDHEDDDDDDAPPTISVTALAVTSPSSSEMDALGIHLNNGEKILSVFEENNSAKCETLQFPCRYFKKDLDIGD